MYLVVRLQITDEIQVIICTDFGVRGGAGTGTCAGAWLTPFQHNGYTTANLPLLASSTASEALMTH